MNEFLITFNHVGEIMDGTFVSHITKRRCLVEKDGVRHDIKMIRTVTQAGELPEGYGYHLVVPDYVTNDYLKKSGDWPTEHGVLFDEDGCWTVQRNYWTWDEINIDNSREIL